MLYADLGIKDVRVIGSKENSEIEAVHRLVSEEGIETEYSRTHGAGVHRNAEVFSRIGMWMEALQNGSVLVVDEIESSLHPLLTRHLIEMVQDAAVNTSHAQLILPHMIRDSWILLF